MLAKRIIPTLLHRGETLVKGKQFNAWRSVGHVQQAARIHAMRGVDELVILDIGATPEGREPDFDLVEKLTEGNFCPIAVGGGISTVEQVWRLLRSGADKVVIGNKSIPPHLLVKPVADKVGCQAIVVAIDHINGRCTAADAVESAKIMEAHGAGEILLTSIDREGMMEGYDLKTIEDVAKSVTIPVIAHGGCGCYEHMYQAIQAGASAVAAGAMFLFTDQTPRGAAEYLHGRGIEVRL